MSAHFFRRTGSVCGRFAFCPNLVFGRLTVFLSSRAVASVDIINRSQKRNSNSKMSWPQKRFYLSLPNLSSPSRIPDEISGKKFSLAQPFTAGETIRTKLVSLLQEAFHIVQ